MSTGGAFRLLFCAAKRSGAFPPNIPAGRNNCDRSSSMAMLALWLMYDELTNV
jgi:hypothetical protein